MVSDVRAEATRLLGEGKSSSQVRIELEGKGYSADDVAEALSDTRQDRSAEESRNSRLFGTKEVFDRIGYGGATPQFINILLWLSQATNPFILAIIGVLNGLKTLLSIVWSGIMQEYAKISSVSKNTMSQAGIIYGFSFLFMSFGLLLGGTVGLALFSLSFLTGIVGSVAYGDLYQQFVDESVRKERWGGLLRSIAHWGVLITAATLLLAGFLLDAFPMQGRLWTVTFFGVHQMKVYGFLLAFEITAFAFIISGYISSLVADKREQKKYPFGQFLREYRHILRGKMHVFSDRYISLLAAAAIIGGFLQIIITAYSGIAMYELFKTQYDSPFFTLAIVYAIAIIASFTGPLFTKLVHRSMGLAPTLVFGTLLMAILPLVIVYNPNIVAITAAMCCYVIGGAITGFAQGVLAQKLMDDDTRRSYFQAQAVLVILPYLLLLALLAVAAAVWGGDPASLLRTLFLIVAASLIVIVMPIYFLLVVISQKQRL